MIRLPGFSRHFSMKASIPGVSIFSVSAGAVIYFPRARPQPKFAVSRQYNLGFQAITFRPVRPSIAVGRIP
jgi:hypothetical protein